MVNQDEICKVGDFGLLRKIPKDAKVYIAKSEFPFPLRWMAPESFQNKEFSPASDVWSFGIVMWEMYNPNRLPYDGMNDMECAINVSQGARLTIPEPYPENLEKVMKACWQKDPSKRPSFLLCAALLTDMYLKFQE
jgi:serine/threonine protein kinase